jgi:hypothetical protein
MLRSIDLWGMLYIGYYNVVCQAFFYFFYVLYFKIAIAICSVLCLTF